MFAFKISLNLGNDPFQVSWGSIGSRLDYISNHVLFSSDDTRIADCECDTNDSDSEMKLAFVLKNRNTGVNNDTSQHCHSDPNYLFCCPNCKSMPWFK